MYLSKSLAGNLFVLFHLCVDGLIGEGRKNARTFASAVYSDICTDSLSGHMEMGKWPDRNEGFAAKY